MLQTQNSQVKIGPAFLVLDGGSMLLDGGLMVEFEGAVRNLLQSKPVKREDVKVKEPEEPREVNPTTEVRQHQFRLLSG